MSEPRLTIDALLRTSQGRLRRLDPAAAWEAMRDDGCLIDIRSGSQIEGGGRIPGALVISRNVLEWRLDPDSPDRLAQAPALGDLPILICQDGYASSLAAVTLQQIGFARATDVTGGAVAWRAARLPMVADGRR